MAEIANSGGERRAAHERLSTGALARWARACATHPRRVFLSWLGILAALIVLVVTEYSPVPKLNLIQFSSGNGDGVYPILVGYDATGQPTRIVVDFYLLHLDWPGSS